MDLVEGHSLLPPPHAGEGWGGGAATSVVSDAILS